MMKLSDNFKNYSKLFKKYGITPGDIDDMNYNISSGRYTMECTVTKYTKQPGYKTFSGANIENETFNISAEFYYNCITGIQFFHDKVTMGYTYAGNIITSLTCYNPDKTVKMIRTFKLIKNS